ncbi:MAG: hypothetical protein ACOCTJ_01080, partial [Desulfobia sp.]
VAGNLAWLIPLFLLAGDPLAYFRASASLASLAVAPTSVFSHNPFGLLRNIAFVAAGILVGVNAALIVIVLGHLVRAKPLSSLRIWEIKFFLLWLIPSLATYTLIHTGQLGYVLLILPLGFLWAGLSLHGLAMMCQDYGVLHSLQHKRPYFSFKLVVFFLAGLLLMANTAGSLYLPQAAYGLVTLEQDSTSSIATEFVTSFSEKKSSSVEHRKKLAIFLRQFHVGRNDAHWSQLIDFVEDYHPDSTAVLALPEGSGSFRHLSYYLPDYRIYGVGEDKNDDFGHLFTAHNGTSDYSVEGLEKAESTLKLPENTTNLIIPDRAVYESLEQNARASLMQTEDGTEVCVVSIPPDSRLRFSQQSEATIRIVPDSHE